MAGKKNKILKNKFSFLLFLLRDVLTKPVKEFNSSKLNGNYLVILKATPKKFLNCALFRKKFFFLSPLQTIMK